MRVNNELIKDVFQEFENYKLDKTLLIRVEFYPNYFFEYIKKNCEDRCFTDYFTPKEEKAVDDFIYDIKYIPDEFDFAISSTSGRGNCITFYADFIRKYRRHDKRSLLLVIMEKPISFNPFYKYIKNDHNPKQISVNGIKCKTYADALDEIRKWFADFKEETDGYQNIQQD